MNSLKRISFLNVSTRILLPLFLLLGTPAWGQFDRAVSSIQSDLEDALRRYAALQAEIRDEKVPLDRQLNALQSELREARREADRAQRLRDNRQVDLNALRERVVRRQEQLDFVANLITDYGQRFERDLDVSERQIYRQQLLEFQAADDRAALSAEGEEGNQRIQRVLEQIFILELAIDRFDRLLGGDVFEGVAVGPTGELENGRFILFGPSSFFASTESPVAGLSLRTGTSPAVFSINREADANVRAVAENGRGILPIDPSLGNAFALDAERDTLFEHIQKGGIWIWPILGFALLAFLTAAYKTFEIYSVKMPEPGALHGILAALNSGDKEKALQLAKQVRGPARLMLVDAVEHSDERKELIEEIMYERMIELQPKLERLLPFIAVTAATAPLMGLLGTVTGMINTFKLITIFGTGDARRLSGGISEALVTTEFGLIVAIPSLIMHALLNRRAQGVMANMERMAVSFVNGLALNRGPDSNSAE